MFRTLDLFSGIGGFSLGLERTGGFETVAFCEIEPFCQAVLRRHWPDVPIYDDIRKLDGADIEPIDVVCGGFPCQPWSVAGKRGGTEDHRDLWPEMLRVVAAVQPAWVVGENVAGLGSMAFERMSFGVESRTGGRTPHGIDYESVSLRQENMQLARICQDLDSLDYQVTVFEIPACAVDAPHRRARLWIVAHCAGTGWTASGRAQEPSERRANDPASSGKALAHGGCSQRRPSVEVRNIGNGPDGGRQETSSGLGECGADVGNATGQRRDEVAGECVSEWREGSAGTAGGAMGDTISAGLAVGQGEPGNDEQECATAERTGHWSDAGIINGRRVKPGVRLLAHGIPRRVDQLRALGNAVVPQIVTAIGNAILEAEGLT